MERDISMAVACPDCDLLHDAIEAPDRGAAHCVRCGGALPLAAPVRGEPELAAALAAMVLLAVALVFPLMRLSELGQVSVTTLPRSALDMWTGGSQATAVLVAVCSFVAPAIYLALVIGALAGCMRTPAAPWAGMLARWCGRVQPWTMPEVMLLGTLVAYVKVSELAHASPGVGMYAVGAVAALIAWLATAVRSASVWSRILARP
jgi:paraquat-inducible protein A